MQAVRRSAWHLWWPFVLLCLLRGSRWMLSESLPGSSTTLASAAVGCGSAAALYVLLVRPSVREARSQILRASVGGALLVVGPLITLLYPHTVPAASLTMALALTPVVIAVAEAATHHASESVAGRLWPGLATIAGLLLVLTEPSLSNPVVDLFLALSPLLTGFGAVLFCSARESVWRLPVALLGACTMLTIGAGVDLAQHLSVWPEMAGLASGFDALEALLALTALARLWPARWSAQFALVPLLVFLEGLLLLHGAVPARLIIGLVLLAVAAAGLLMPPAEDSPFELGASQPDPAHSD